MSMLPTHTYELVGMITLQSSDPDALLGTPVIGHGREVLSEPEARRVHEEVDGWFVLADQDSNVAEMHSAGIRATVLAGLPCRILASIVLNAQHAAAAYADSGLNRRAAAGRRSSPRLPVAWTTACDHTAL